MRRLLLPLLLILVSCAAEEFTVSSLSLTEDDGDAYISAVFSDPESIYSFRITSPDGDLVWEGAFSGDGEEKKSEALEITPGASFPVGEYSLILYSDNGTEVRDTVNLVR